MADPIYPSVPRYTFNPYYSANPYYGGYPYNEIDPYNRCGGYGGYGIYDIPPWRGLNSYAGYGKVYRPIAADYSLLVAPAIYRAQAGRNISTTGYGRQNNAVRPLRF